MNKIDKEKLPYKYQDMIEELTDDTVKFFGSHTIYKIKSQTELLRVARQFRYERCRKQDTQLSKRKIYLVDVIATSKTIPQDDYLLLTQLVFNEYDLDLLLKAYPKSRYKEI